MALNFLVNIVIEALFAPHDVTRLAGDLLSFKSVEGTRGTAVFSALSVTRVQFFVRLTLSAKCRRTNFHAFIASWIRACALHF